MHRHAPHSLRTKALTCGGLVLLGDFLFYHHAIGFTLGLFSMVLLAATAVLNPEARQWQAQRVLMVLLSGLGVSMLLQPNWLNIALYGVGAATLALLMRNMPMATPQRLLLSVGAYLVRGLWRIIGDLYALLRIRRRRPKTHCGCTIVQFYLLPVSFSVIFILLFMQANPIIDRWLQQVEWMRLGAWLAPLRIALWAAIAAGCWALLRPRMRPVAECSRTGLQLRWLEPLLNPVSILYSLIAFNGLFLIQNSLDLGVLASPDVLPAGITYAQYAHQGAYPLIATALLAALFVLVALKPGSRSEGSSTIRALVYLWVGQNIVLVGFSLSRLYHYVSEYSLTHLRLSAAIWMVLVACGLCLIVARIYAQKNNAWLIRQNLLLASAVLYCCSFIPMGHLIAQFNVRHCQEIRQEGPLLDISYLEEIGPQALPALQWYLDHAPGDAVQAQATHHIMQNLKQQVIVQQSNWRGRTLLQEWLALASPPLRNQPVGVPISADGWQIQYR